MESITQLAEDRADELRALEAQTEQNPGEAPVEMTEVVQPAQSGAAEEVVEEDPVAKPKKRKKTSLDLQRALKKIKNKEGAFAYTYADTENEEQKEVHLREEKMSRYANIGRPSDVGSSSRNEFWVEMYEYDDDIYLDIYMGFASQGLYRDPTPSPPPPPAEREIGEQRWIDNGNSKGRLVGIIAETNPVFIYNRKSDGGLLDPHNEYKVFLPQSEGGFEITKQYIKRNFKDEVKFVREVIETEGL